MNHKLHIWLTAVFLLAVNNIIGAENEITEPFTTQTIDKTDLAKKAGTGNSSSATGLFANGHSIIIEEGTSSGNIKVSTTDLDPNVSVELPGATTVVFGGKYNDKCETTNITLKSGTVYSIVGGGYGTASGSSADVGSATVNLDGGTVNYWVIGGGAYYSKTEIANINAKGAGSPIVHSWMIGCMESGAITGAQYPEYTDAPCSVGTMNLNIQKGKYWIIALAGGNGDHSFTKTGKAFITGTKDAPVIIEGGLFGCGSNGRGESAKATVEYCDLSSKALELASVNRGKLETVDFTFKNCTFSNDIYAYLGGTYKWGDGYSSSAVGVPQYVKFTFDPSCTNVPLIGISEGLDKASVELNGAKGLIAPFENGKTTVNSFTIGDGKSWTFNNGLEIGSDINLTKTGTLKVKGIYTVATSDQLEEALLQKDITDIQLSSKEYTLTKPLVLDKSITLSSVTPSAKATIKGNISITAEDVTVKDINFSYERKSSLFSDKIGICVFANEATITGNTFTTTGDGTNGIVFYPVGTTATQKYTVTGNTFSLAGAASTGIIVRENFKSTTQIPGVTTATASLSNGSALDQQIIAAESKNTFGNMAGGYYVRVTGNYSEKDATGSGSEAITQKYIYSYVNEGNVADAIASSQMGATVNATSVASSSLAGKMNALETKTALANGIKILCSDMTVYSDLASALAATTADKAASYLKLDETTYSLVEAKKATPTIAEADKPTASEIEVGQPLSASLLSDGSAKVGDKAIAGVFSWTKPNNVVNAESGQYDVLFTPIDQALYTTATAKVTVKAKQYYTVTAGKCENGKVEITGANASNRYIKDTTLTVKAIPAEHYQFDKWTEGTDSYTVTEDASLVATFKAITHKVTFGEDITVLNAGTAIKSGADVAEGSVLTVTASKDGNKLTSLTSNKKNIINNQVVVDGALNIEATFEALPASTRLVKVDYSDANTQNGKVQLFDKDGNIIESGSAVAVGNTVSVVAVPDYGYKVGELTVTGATHQNNQFKVEANDAAIVVKQVFEKRTFAVTLPTEGTDHAKVAIEGSSNLDAVPFDTELTIKSASASAGYKLISIIVNGKEVAKGGKFKVSTDTKVNAVVEKLPEIQFTDTEQSCTYNGQEQAFVVRTIPAGISDITLSYGELGDNTKPTEVGKYIVYASFTATEKFASLSNKEIGTLEIKKAELTGATIPVYGDVKENESAASNNEYYWSKTIDGNFREATFKLPADLSKNYENPKFIIPTTTVDEIKLDIQSSEATPANASLNERSIALRNGKTQTLIGVNGTIAVYNGPVKVEGTAYDGQTLTLKAIPNAGFSSIPTWTGNGVKDNQDGTATVVLGEGEVTATFKAKEAAPIKTAITVNSTYNGVIYGTNTPNLSSLVNDLPGWSLDIKQGGLTVEPTNAGSYDIVASRQEDEAYAATSITIGTLSIAKATPVLTDVMGSDIIAGQTLRESVLSGTSNVQGTFSWKNPDTQMNTVNANQKAIAIFKSDDSNYTDKEVEATLNVMAKSESITTRTLTLTVNNPENGKPVVTTLNGTPFTGSISVKKDDVLKVTFEANNNCTASATINGTTYTSGSTYTIGETDNVEVVVTFTKKSTPDTDPDEPSYQPIAVTGVSLDTTDKTLAVNETLILGATVKPANADNKDVRWSSSDATVASVDQDGKVKALKAGTCTITVTTDDGNFTATCKITVTTATGIDDILAVNRVYSQNGQIVIEPMYQPEVWITDLTGRIMYHDRIAEKTQVAASAGIYLVRLSESGKSKTIKVIVK